MELGALVYGDSDGPTKKAGMAALRFLSVVTDIGLHWTVTYVFHLGYIVEFIYKNLVFGIMANKLKLGGYPAEYDPVRHGPYDPARYYGKPDTAFLDLKLSEIPGWFARRQKSPQAIAGLFSRAFWRWQHKYVQPRRAGIAPFFQAIVASMFVFYVMNYKKIRHHRTYKYH